MNTMINQIFNQNIWWQDKGLIGHDPKIKEYNSQKFKWRPAIIAETELRQFAVYTLRGPRQVGKTTALKLLIRDILENKAIQKEQVMYYSCDNLDNHKELIELIETYLDHIRKLNLHKQRLFIFLDEITSVMDWQKGIKHLVDNGRLSTAGMVLTGSNASDLRRGAERLPGRRGSISNPDRVLLPLRFREFVNLLHPAFYRKLDNSIEIFNLGDKEFKTLASFQPYVKELSVLLEQYLMTGGIMRAVNEYFSKNEISYEIYEIYQQWLRGDISRAGKSERTARQIIAELIKISVSAFGWETIAKKIDVASHKTVSDYIETMEDSFVFKTLYQIDPDTAKPRVKKMKKLYFLDSFILWSLWGWSDNWLAYGDMITKSLIGTNLKSRLTEMIVAGELFARFDRFDWLNSNVFFWRNGREIDFIVKRERQLLPIEVKYQKRVDFSDFATINKLGFSKGILVSMDRLEKKGGFVILPLELFLMTKG